MEWNEEIIGRLRAFWADGLSTAEIGRRMGISKNAVVGKAHRLNLPPRPSPIRRGAADAPRIRNTVRRVSGPTLPPLPVPAASGPSAAAAAATPRHPVAAPAEASQHEAEPFPSMAELREPDAHQALPRATAPAPRPMVAPPLRAVSAPRVGRFSPCCWPIGEPGTANFRFCDVESLAGKPYCGTHAQIAYVKVRDRREEAAA